MNPAMQSLYPQKPQSMQPQQSTQSQQPQQQQYDFSGWGDRLNKIEQGIAGLTDQFNNFQTPGDVAPEYQGNAAPEPLEQNANATGIESLVANEGNPFGGTTFDPNNPQAILTPGGGVKGDGLGTNTYTPKSAPMMAGLGSLPQTQSSGFNFDPSGGSLFDQMSTAYGQPATMTQQFQQENPNANYIPKGGQDFTQGFQDFIGQQGYFVDDKSSFDAGMGISQTPTQDYGVKGFGFDKMQQMQNQNNKGPGI